MDSPSSHQTSVVIDTALHKILIISTWPSDSPMPMYEGPTWRILGGLKIQGSEKRQNFIPWVQISVISDARCVDAHLDALDAVHVTGCAIIKDLSGYQQSNPVSSVAVPAAHPKMEKYLGNSEFPCWVTDSGEIPLFFPFLLAHKFVNSSCRSTPTFDLLCSQYVH